MWLWLKLTSMVDFCVISVRAFFVNFFEHTKGYLNEQISNFSSKHPKWDQTLQFTSQRETTSIPVSFTWKPPPPGNDGHLINFT